MESFAFSISSKWLSQHISDDYRPLFITFFIAYTGDFLSMLATDMRDLGSKQSKFGSPEENKCRAKLKQTKASVHVMIKCFYHNWKTACLHEKSVSTDVEICSHTTTMTTLMFGNFGYISHEVKVKTASQKLWKIHLVWTSGIWSKLFMYSSCASEYVGLDLYFMSV